MAKARFFIQLEEIIKKTAGKPEHTGIFNNVAQVMIRHKFSLNPGHQLFRRVGLIQGQRKNNGKLSLKHSIV